MPRISVVLPVRNGERYIHASVMSTLRALPADAELRVLDDASTDRTQAVLAEVSDPRLVIESATTSLGVSGALNRLIRAGDSEFVARMDADDVSLPFRFRQALRRIEGADLLFSGYLRTNENGRVRPRQSFLNVPIDPRAEGYHLLMGNNLVHPTMFARRSALPTDPYAAVASEDYELWLRLISLGRRIARAPVPAIRYREHTSQLTNSQHWKQRRTNLGEAEPGVVSSHRAAAERLGVNWRADGRVVLFCQTAIPPEDETGRRQAIAFLEEVRGQIRHLRGHERWLLELKLRLMDRRLAS